MKKEIKVRTKILEASKNLFYRNGYSETGINQILKEAAVFKKSLYDHFASKQDLGVEYVKLVKMDLLNLIQKLLDKHPKFEDFTQAWINLLRKRILKKYFNGCPLINLPTHLKNLNKAARLAFKNLKEPLILYFMKNYSYTREKSKRISEEILFLYEGALNSYKLDPNLKYLNYFQKHLEYVLKE